MRRIRVWLDATLFRTTRPKPARDKHEARCQAQKRVQTFEEISLGSGKLAGTRCAQSGV